MTIHDNIFHNYKDHNPFWRARSPSYISRRDHLFVTLKQKTPGMIPKILMAGSVFLTLLGFVEFKRARMRKERSQVVTYEFNRKALPFFQAIEDRRFLAVEQRKDWMLEELFKENPEEYLYLKRLYNDPSIWVQPFSRTSLYMGGIARSYKGQARRAITGLKGSDDYTKGVPEAHY